MLIPCWYSMHNGKELFIVELELPIVGITSKNGDNYSKMIVAGL